MAKPVRYRSGSLSSKQLPGSSSVMTLEYAHPGAGPRDVRVQIQGQVCPAVDPLYVPPPPRALLVTEAYGGPRATAAARKPSLGSRKPGGSCVGANPDAAGRSRRWLRLEGTAHGRIPRTPSSPGLQMQNVLF